jgi:hypothetical protein
MPTPSPQASKPMAPATTGSAPATASPPGTTKPGGAKP